MGLVGSGPLTVAAWLVPKLAGPRLAAGLKPRPAAWFVLKLAACLAAWLMLRVIGWLEPRLAAWLVLKLAELRVKAWLELRMAA